MAINFQTFKYTICFIGLLSLLSCNNQKIEELKDEIEQKDKKILQLEEKVSYLSQFEPNNEINVHSEEEIEKILKSKLDFYCTNIAFKEFKFRKIDRQTFDINYKYRVRGYSMWISGFYRIRFLPNDMYNLQFKKGPTCAKFYN